EGNGRVGYVIYQGFGNTIQNNVAAYNDTGIRIVGDATDNLVSGNDVGHNTNYGVRIDQGGDPRNVEDGRPKRNVADGNTVHDNGNDGLLVINADNTTVSNNTFTNNNTRSSGDEFTLDGAQGTTFTGNALPFNLDVMTVSQSSPTASTVITGQSSI